MKELVSSEFRASRFYSELNRVASMLLVGVLALMALLLTVGVQRPHAGFAWALYTSLVLLGLNLVMYVVGNAVAVMSARPAAVASDVKDDAKDDDKEASKPVTTGRTRSGALRFVRVVQQVLFVLAVIAVIWFAIQVAGFFFTLPAQPTTVQ